MIFKQNEGQDALDFSIGSCTDWEILIRLSNITVVLILRV